MSCGGTSISSSAASAATIRASKNPTSRPGVALLSETSLQPSTSLHPMTPRSLYRAPSPMFHQTMSAIPITVPLHRPTRRSPSRNPAYALPARLPYELHVHGDANTRLGTIQLRFRNSGQAGAVFHVRTGDGLTGPWTYTVGAGDETSDEFGASGATSYDLSVFGPNGFLRTFAGSAGSRSANLTVKTICDRESEGIVLEIHNHGSNAEKVNIVDAYSGKTTTHQVQPDSAFTHFAQLEKSFGWYDLTVQVAADASFQRRLAGHVETGRDSKTDPAIGN